MEFKASDRFSLRHDLVVERIDDDVVVLDLAGNQYFGLEGTAFEIWQAIADHNSDLATIAAALADTYDGITVETARRDAEKFIGQLVKAGLATRQAAERHGD